jgi:pimeloyl-ACP methyl ester carboxylesterase
VNQGQLFCRELGHGPAVIFLHGSWQDSEQWLPLMAHLGRDFHCIAVDLLGCGDSDRPTTHYSISLQTECLAELLDTLQLEQVGLVGHELGGWVAAYFALRYPERVTGLALLGAEGVVPATANNPWTMAWWLTMRPPLFPWLLRSLRPLAALVGTHRRFDSLLRWRRQLLQSRATCQMLFRRRRAELQGELVYERITELKPPLLILQGEGDRSLAADRNQIYARAARAELVLIPDSGEDLLQTHPETVARILWQFLKP